MKEDRRWERKKGGRALRRNNIPARKADGNETHFSPSFSNSMACDKHGGKDFEDFEDFEDVEDFDDVEDFEEL